jgi:hypothetical protein
MWPRTSGRWALIASIALGILTGSAKADTLTPRLSAYRLPGEHFEEAMMRTTGLDARIFAIPRFTPLRIAEPPGELNVGLIPTWGNEQDIQRAFERIRDDHFLKLPEDPSHPRTIPWGYAYDGCYARAALASAHIEELGLRRPAKLFVFGDLSFESRSDGRVNWWFHVAPVVAHDGKIYVLDPAIEPSHPLQVGKWLSRIAPDRSSVRLEVCNPFAYMPESLCYVSGPWAEGSATQDGLDFVRALEQTE